MLDVMYYSHLKDFVISHVMIWSQWLKWLGLILINLILLRVVGWIDYIENHH
jgi:hypothetical protein